MFTKQTYITCTTLSEWDQALQSWSQVPQHKTMMKVSSESEVRFFYSPAFTSHRKLGPSTLMTYVGSIPLRFRAPGRKLAITVFSLTLNTMLYQSCHNGDNTPLMLLPFEVFSLGFCPTSLMQKGFEIFNLIFWFSCA